MELLMHHRILPAVCLVAIWLTGLGSAVDAQAPSSAPRIQIPVESLPTAPVIDRGAIHELLLQGRQLEQRRHWADALVHYEEASRRYPDQHELNERLEQVRIHFDLARRYADRSFVDAVHGLDADQASELFGEVCLKIESHYVDNPRWSAVLTRGTSNLDIAIRDGVFQQAHVPCSVSGDVDSLVHHLRRTMADRPVADRHAARSLVLYAARLAQQHAGLPPAATILEYVCGAVASLDDYSTFLTPEQLDDVYAQIEGNFVGLGIELKATGGSLLISDVIAGGPADLAGIVAGDRIVEVDGLSMRDISTDEAAEMLKGEQGSVVRLVVTDRRDRPRDVSVRRARVEVPCIEDVRMVDTQSGIAYLKLTSFQKTTSRDMDAALWRLHSLGMRSLIIDVRGNPGGLLTESVEVADKFVMDGTIVSTRGRSPREDFDYRAHRVGTWRVPLVVLIDGNSASASEIFAGAIRDHRRGTVVGNRSYGKGSVQGIFPLGTIGSGLRLTTAKFYAPSGRPISRQGVHPDVTVRDKVDADSSQDAVLQAGIEVARQQLAQRPVR
jgi:carboxyl-terminal processing protease